MIQIYSTQAKYFLEPHDGLYGRKAGRPVMPYMVRLSTAIRNRPIEQRHTAIKMAQANMFEAWARIHRAMRPYFFEPVQFDSIDQAGAIELPTLDDKPYIHHSMHFCLDVLVDLDRLVLLLNADPNATNKKETIEECWGNIYRALGRLEGIERRITTGKGF